MVSRRQHADREGQSSLDREFPLLIFEDADDAKGVLPDIVEPLQEAAHLRAHLVG